MMQPLWNNKKGIKILKNNSKMILVGHKELDPD